MRRLRYDLQHNTSVLSSEPAQELYKYAKNMADVVIPQEYGITRSEKLTIAQGICAPLLRKIRADLQRNVDPGSSSGAGGDDMDRPVGSGTGDHTSSAETTDGGTEEEEEVGADEDGGEDEASVFRLNPRYSSGVCSPGRHVRTRLYFTSESHIHSLLTVLSLGGLVDAVRGVAHVDAEGPLTFVPLELGRAVAEGDGIRLPGIRVKLLDAGESIRPWPSGKLL